MKQVQQEEATSIANLAILNDRIKKLEADEIEIISEKQKITEYATKVKQSLDQARTEFTALVKQIDQKHAELVNTTKRLVTGTAERTSPALNR